MRGALRQSSGRLQCKGIIPAYAGSTRSASTLESLPRDHPRVCGEHRSRRNPTAGCAGSSPRMRGAPGQRHADHRPAGIIPAYAGSTREDARAPGEGEDHPRVCGEHPRQMRWLVTSFGSSPRMRGARTARSSGPSSWRIIPAYAGSTVVPVAVPREAEDHPRVCGEHQHRGSPSLLVRGSSPRMRGAPQRRNDFTARIGIIPAYAGSTPREQKSSGPTTDHPRVCGEHCGRNGQILPLWGSSPRMRGALADAVSEIQYIGIIPAYAGSTEFGRCGLSDGQDHPRVCGEHTAPQFLPIRSSGSSPRMRGAPGGDARDVAAEGIIPAYAGSTT